MTNIHYRLLDKFRNHWIAVKFCKKKPADSDYKTASSIRFCQAVTDAICSPLLLGPESISCLGANYAFNWNTNKISELIPDWQKRRNISKDTAESLLKSTPKLKEGIKYIGLNTKDKPDIIIAYMTPQDTMNLVSIYQNKTGRKLKVDLSGVISVCGNVAVKTYLTQKINISFGCEYSREYAQINKDRLIVGIPKKLFKIFID